MKNLAIVLLSLSTIVNTTSLYGMDHGKRSQGRSWADMKDAERTPSSYRDATTDYQQEYRSSRTVAAYPERYSDNPNRPNKLWQPNRSQQQQAQEPAQTQELSASPKPLRAITLLTQSSPPTPHLHEQTHSNTDKQDAVTLDNKMLQKLALLSDMLPAVLKRQAQQEATITELKKELTTQAQVHQQQQCAVDSEHKKTLQALHEEFNRQMLSKQEELSKRAIEHQETITKLQQDHARTLADIAQQIAQQNQNQYAIAFAMGLVQPPAPAQEEALAEKEDVVLIDFEKDE